MRPSDGGFTLIEVLLAILIGSVLLTTIYGIFGSVSNTRDQLEQEGEAYHQVRIFFDRIGGELSSLRPTPVSNRPAFSSEQTLEGEQAIEFNTELVSPLLKQRGGLSRVRYELRRGDESATLFRSEQVLLADLAASEALPFVAGLKSFKIRYYQRGQWLDQWSNSSPPQLLEIALVLDVAGRDIPFRSNFLLPKAGG
jgi:general secretion pathway protein J